LRGGARTVRRRDDQREAPTASGRRRSGDGGGAVAIVHEGQPGRQSAGLVNGGGGLSGGVDGGGERSPHDRAGRAGADDGRATCSVSTNDPPAGCSSRWRAGPRRPGRRRPATRVPAGAVAGTLTAEVPCYRWSPSRSARWPWTVPASLPPTRPTARPGSAPRRCRWSGRARRRVLVGLVTATASSRGGQQDVAVGGIGAPIRSV